MFDAAAVTAALPVGRWAVGVSGGADSVALTRLLVGRGDGNFVLAHLDHQLRDDASDADAAFVADLGRRLRVLTEIARISDVRSSAASPSPSGGGGEERNASARYRAARLAFFTDLVRRHGLDGVVLAHHADDQAETVLLRLQRGRGLPFLGGMSPRAVVGGLTICRPLLGVRRDDLRAYLRSIGQPWREDASNASPTYRRNVLRQWLAERPSLTPALLRLAEASRRWRDALDVTAPRLAESFARDALRTPPPLAEHAARRWLVARGAPADRVSPAVCRRLVAQATDVAQSPRQHYPGGLLVRRRAGRIDVIPSPPVQSPRHGQETDAAAEL